jgi:hypothetical protein
MKFDDDSGCSTRADATRSATRRDFVALTTLGLAGSALAPLRAPAQTPTRGSRISVDREESANLSVGLVQGSDRYPGFEVLPWESGLSYDDEQYREWWNDAPRVIPASQLGLGDQNLVHTHVQLRVHGVYPDVDSWWRLGVEKVELQVMYRSLDPAVPGPFPFLAWSYDGRPVPMPAQRVRFVAPIDETGTLEVLLRVRRLVAGASGSASAGPTVVQARQHAGAFTVDWQDARPKLQRGVYLLGLGADTWSRSARLPGRGERVRPELSSLVVSVEPLGEDLSQPA